MTMRRKAIHFTDDDRFFISNYDIKKNEWIYFTCFIDKINISCFITLSMCYSLDDTSIQLAFWK